MKILGLIPARGGSKGVPDKNIKLIDGKPLIAYTIEAAKESKLLTKIVVSTDSNKIIDIVKKYHCNYLKRSSKNAQDTSTIEPVIFEVLDQLKSDFDIIVLLQPTAPIREGKDIDEVIKLFIENKKLECVVSVVELNDIHPARMYNLDESFKMLPLNKNLEKRRRQDLPSVFLRNGAIYAVKVSEFLKDKTLIRENKKAYVMPESKWLNIDTPRDLLFAEVMIKEWKMQKKDA